MYLSEYLPRLDQISVTVDVPSTNNAIKSLSLRENKLLIQTATKGNSSERTPDSTWSNITDHEAILPVQDRSILSGAKISQLKLKDNALSVNFTFNSSNAKTAPAPFTALPNSSGLWSVGDLLKKTPRNADNVSEFRFVCSSCENVVVDSKTHKFVDMPSEYWHEMMDFWHCHKPHEEHHDIGIDAKNYEGKLNPKPGFVHVGNSYILIPSVPANCVACNHQLGTLEGDTLKANKWNIYLKYGEITEEYPPYSLVYFAILDRVNSSGVRKFTVKTTASSLVFNVWVTSVGLDVSYNEKISKNVLKLLYTTQENSPDDDVIEVPIEVGTSLEKYFTESTQLLPKSLRKVDLMDGEVMRHYNVCYLSTRSDNL